MTFLSVSWGQRKDEKSRRDAGGTERQRRDELGAESRQHLERWTSYHLDPHLTPRSCERPISCDERSIQGFGKSQISGVISRKTVPHLPDAREQDVMRVAGERKVNKVGESFGAAVRRYSGGAHVAAQDLRDFQVNEVRGMERLIGGEDEAVHTGSSWRLKKNLKN